MLLPTFFKMESKEKLIQFVNFKRMPESFSFCSRNGPKTLGLRTKNKKGKPRAEAKEIDSRRRMQRMSSSFKQKSGTGKWLPKTNTHVRGSVLANSAFRRRESIS